MTRPQPRKVARLIAVPFGAALTLALAACSPIQSMEPYAASDGVRTVVNEDVVIENLMIISAAEGEAGAVQGGIRNDGGSTNASIGDQLVPVEAGETVLIGGELGIDITIDPVDVAPGATMVVSLSAGASASQEVPVPVLDGTLSEYEPLLPAADTEG